MKEGVEKVRNGAMKIGQAMYANQGQQSSGQEQSQGGQEGQQQDQQDQQNKN